MDQHALPTVAEVVLLLAPGERETPWAREGPTRHALRRYLLIGCHWTRSWHRADMKAASLVALARAGRKVHLPRGWDSDGDLSAWIPTVECVICGKFVLHRYESQQYCSVACSRRGTELERWSIARVGAIGPPRCQFCRNYMETDIPGQVYCNIRCKRSANIMEAHEQADVELGKKIAAARYARGLSQAALADMVGVTRPYITAIEIGTMPGTADLREQILNILELDPATPVPPPVRVCCWCDADISAKHPNAQYCNANHRRYARGERRPHGATNGHCDENDRRHDAGDRPDHAGDAPGIGDDQIADDGGAARTSRDDRTATAS